MTPTLTSPLTVPAPPLTPLTATRDNPMPIDALGERIAELAARIHAATYELLVMLREYDEGRGWNNGYLSCAHWLNWRTGIDLGAAREKVRVARALPGLPLISAALACGSISYAKVRAITRVATPETEQRLLDVALAGTASHVERIVRAWRRTDRVIAAQEADARHLSRHLTTWIDDDGMLVLRGRLTPEVGAVLHRALEAAADQLRRESKDAPETRPGRRGHLGPATSGCVGAAGRDGPHRGPRRRTRRGSLSGGLARGGGGRRRRPGRPDVAGPGGGVLEVEDAAIRVSAETSQRLACDASVVTMHHDADGQVLDVGRKTRTIPTAIRRALSARDTRCQFPGCSATRCDAHHIDHWMDGGPTSLDNLVLLCRRHHRLVHEGGFTLRWRPDRTIAFFDPSRWELRIAPPQPRIDVIDPLAPTTERLAAQGIVITPRTLPTWDGGPLNLGYAIDVLYVPRAIQRTTSPVPRDRPQ